MRRKNPEDIDLLSIQDNSIRSSSQISLAGIARAGALLWESPFSSALLALIIYTAVSSRVGGMFGISPWPFYNYLADAFFHGQLALRLIPANTHDLVYYAGKYYLYWPPFPAILMIPVVAIFGVGVSDIAITTLLGGLAVGMVAYLLRLVDRRGVIPLALWQRAVLVLFFAFGTVIFTLAPRGRVWFTGQIVGFLFVLLAYIAVLRLRGWKAFLLAGTAMAAAAATRNHMIFAGIWPAYYLIKEHASLGWRRLAGYCLVGAAPVAAAVALLALYNFARFGNLTDVGLAYHQMAGEFLNDFHKYGAFNLHYLGTNFYYQYIYYPLPLNKNTFEGGSLFLLSPLFFAAFFGFTGSREERRSALFLLASILLVNVPILLLMGTGWVQFGPRYSLDFTVPLLLLTARGMKKWPTLLITLAVLISIATYFYGAVVQFP